MLVTLIATMVVFSTLGAVMVGMFGTSTMSQASGNTSMRAYYLAESGFRYAASCYIAVNLGNETANETERNRVLKEDLHNKEFTLGSGDGKFNLHIYPYYYRAQNITGSSQQWLNTEVPGGYPLSSSNYKYGSWVQIKKADGSLFYERILGASLIFPNTVQFTRYTGGWDTAYTGAEVTPACLPVTNATLADVDGDGVPDLRFQADTGADAFPSRNGVFTVNVAGQLRMLAYRELDTANRLLKGVTDPNNPGINVTGLVLDSGNNYVALTKFMQVESTGTFGSGTSAISRKVTYFVPIGYAKAISGFKSKFSDPMESLANWITGFDISKIGSLETSVTFGKASKINEQVSNYMTPGGTCLKFKEFQAGLNLSAAMLPSGNSVYQGIQQEWLRAGHYLSYDVQSKVYSSLAPHTPMAVGVTFRLDEQGNALGFTLARGVPGQDSNGCDIDGIPWGWLGDIPGYTNYTHVLLLWMKQFPTMYGFSPSQVVDETPAGLNPLPPATRAVKTDIGFNWQNGTRVRMTASTGGTLPSPLVQGKDYYIRVIGSVFSNSYIYFFTDPVSAICSGCTALNYWQNLVAITGPGSGTTNTMIAQEPIFTKLAHQVLTSGNESYGVISSASGTMKAWTTFLARVIEAPSVSFTDGGGPSRHEILSGEVVYQTSNNLPGGPLSGIYRVARSPVYRDGFSGDRGWSSSSARGVLILEVINGNSYSDPITYPFTAGSKIFVGDHPSGMEAGTVGVSGEYFPDTAFRVRDNWLMTYVADPTGKSPADSNPFNNYRGPVPRESVLWPPDNAADTVASNDNFTLICYNDYYDLTYLYPFGSKYNPGPGPDVLRFTSPDGTKFYSPSSGNVFPASRAEVGLHAYGISQENATYYDDFAIQFGPSYDFIRKGFLLPIQQ